MKKIIVMLLIALPSITGLLYLMEQESSKHKVGSVSLKWKNSYETTKYNTPSGKLENNQYARLSIKEIIVNQNDKIETHSVNYLISRMNSLSSSTVVYPNLPILTEVSIIGKQWFDVFEGLNGEKIEVPITEEDYKALERPKETARQPTKSIIVE